MTKLHEDEFMIVRVRDGTIIIPRLFLTTNGLADSPIEAERENNKLAVVINNRLENERVGQVSFGVIRK